MSNKEKDLQFIKDFSKIRVLDICNDLKINKSNIWNGRASEKNIKLVKDEIIRRVEELKKD